MAAASLQDCLALGVIFAATDSVAVLQVLKQDRSPLLYSLVFGEGVINDATAVALLRAVQVWHHFLQRLALQCSCALQGQVSAGEGTVQNFVEICSGLSRYCLTSCSFSARVCTYMLCCESCQGRLASATYNLCFCPAQSCLGAATFIVALTPKPWSATSATSGQESGSAQSSSDIVAVLAALAPSPWYTAHTLATTYYQATLQILHRAVHHPLQQ